MHTRVLVAAAAVLVAAAAPAFAADRKVPQKYATIQAAADAAQSGDRIVVSAGTYAEEVLVAGKDRLQFLARGKVVWDGLVGGKHRQCLEVIGASTVVQGFTFRAGSGHVALHGNGVAIRRCASLTCLDTAFRVDAQTPAAIVSSRGAVIDRCVFRSTQGDAISGGLESSRVTRCTITGCEGNAFALFATGTTFDRCAIDGSPGPSVTIFGSSNKVTNGRFRRIAGITLNGDDCTAARNSVATTSGMGIRVQGDGAIIDRNKVSGSKSGGIGAVGGSAKVTGNRVSDCENGGITVAGPGAHVVTGNTVKGISSGTGITVLTDGYNPKARAAVVPTLVSKNTATDVLESGFTFRSDVAGMDKKSCRALRCGAACGSGFQVLGADVRLDHCTATGCDGNGFLATLPPAKTRFTALPVVFRSCSARNCAFDGFQVDVGVAAAMTDCQASGCQGEGLDHRGSGSTFVRCRFRTNRIDFANSGSFDGAAPGHGTESDHSEVDCLDI